MSRRFRSLCWLALGGLAGVAPAFGAPSEMPPAAGAGAQALVRGDANQAVERYSDALKDTALSNDRRATILNDRGVALIKLGQPKAAIDDFNSAAQLFPEYAAVYNNRGNLLLSLGSVKEAQKDFDRAIILAPGYAAAYNNRAGALVQLGRVEDALRDYTKAVELMPQNPAPLSGRGRAHLALGRPVAAIRDFSRAVTADARFAAGYRNRAEALLAVERFDEAIEDLSRAIAFDVNNADSYVMRGQAYLSARNTASALKDFSEAVELNPRSAAAFAARGFAHGLADANDEAFGDLNKAIEIDPRSGLAFAYRAYIYKQAGQVDVAERDIEMAEKLSPEQGEVYWVKAEIDEAQGQPDLAIQALKKAVQLKPRYPEAIEALQRLGGGAGLPEERIISGAGIDTWRVVERQRRFYAVNDLYPRLSIPLEMIGQGEPRLLEWEIKPDPFKGIGTLRFNCGKAAGRAGPEDYEQVAIVDLTQSQLIAIEPHRQGEKVSTWTWGEGKVSVASIDGISEELPLRAAVATGPAYGASREGTAYSDGAPWNDQMSAPGTFYGQQPPKTAAPSRKKSKTLFDLLFN